MNISEAAILNGVSRGSVHRWKKIFIEHGEQGLEIKKKNRTGRSQRTNESIESVLALAKSNPDWGCNKIAQELKLKDKTISSPTVQSILTEHNLATQAERCTRLEQDWMDGKIKPTDEQYKSMLSHNPCLNDRSFFKESIGLQVVGVGIYPKKVRIGTLLCNIVVTIDLSSLTARCIIFEGKLNRKLNRDQHVKIHQDAGSFRDNPKQPLHIVYSCKTSPHSGLFENFHEIRSIKNSGGAKSIGAMRYFFYLLEDEFFPTVIGDDNVNNTNELNQRLQIWLENYNMNKKRPGFPTFGLTPYQCKSQIKPPANFFQNFPMFIPEYH